jgi:hypothetical protein
MGPPTVYLASGWGEVVGSSLVPLPRFKAQKAK